MKTNKLYILLLFIAAPLFMACSSDNDEGGDDSGVATQFAPSKESTTYFANGIDFDANSGEKIVTFTTNKRWTASSTEGWCTVTPYGSPNDGIMTISVGVNYSDDSREAIVTLKMDELSYEIIVRQSGAGTAKIHLDAPGTLEQQLGEDYGNIKELILTGELNGTDFKFLREKMKHSIEVLDLSEVRIVSGGDSYLTILRYDQYDNVSVENYYTETDKITDYFFRDFGNLKSIKLPLSIISIGSHAFDHCKKLTSIDIPEGVTSIGSWAFWYCYNLSSVNIPETVTQIGQNAFDGCTHLARIDLPESVTKISTRLLTDCSNLKDITYSSKLDSIEFGAFANCTSLEKITIQKSVKSVDDAWFGCTNLKTLEYHSEVIGRRLWTMGCPNLSNIIIGDEVQVIVYQAFYGYEALRTLTIPANVKKLGDNIFEGCNMETLYMESMTPPETDGCLTYDDWDKSNHTNAMGKCTLYVPKGAKEAYQKVGCPWTDFKEIVEY